MWTTGSTLRSWGDAIASSSAPAANEMPVVPIDAIPVLIMAATPRDDDLTIFGDPVEGSPGAPTDGFVKRGDFAYRYDLKSVLLETSDGSPALMTGNKPSVWWTLNPPADGNLTAQLSLLNWTPNPAPKALERTEFMEQTIVERWGTICNDAAPAGAVLWTFSREPLGPSESGWNVDGIAWPDPADTIRSEDVELNLHVHETWRTGDRALDRSRGLIPAIIEGGKVFCFPDNLPEPPSETPGRPTRPITPRDLGSERARIPTVSFAELPPEIADLMAPRPAPETPAERLVRPTVPLTRVTPLRRTPTLTTRAPLGTTITNLRAAATRTTTTLGSGATPIRFRDLQATERARLAEATAGSFGRRKAETLDAAPIKVDEALRRLSAGEAVNRSALLGGLSAASTGATTGRFNDNARCDGRILAAPLWDIGDPVVFGDKTRADQIQQELDLLGHKHGPLSDVIQIDCGPIMAGAILLWVNERLVLRETGNRPHIALHYLDESGAILAERPLFVTDMVSVTGLPARWVDVSGPWIRDIFHTAIYAQMALPQRTPALFQLDPPEGCVALNIGVAYPDRNTARKMEHMGRAYYVGAIELTSVAEATRSDWDQTQIDRDRSVVESFLGPESGDIALMFPNKTYKVTTVTEVKVRDNEGAIQDDPNQVSTHWFRTDNKQPRRLDPWLLATIPAEKESHVFGHEDLKIVFATNDVDKIYAAYGKELRARLKAASFRQVDEPDLQHPFPITDATLDNVKAHALSPFEAVIVDLLAEVGPCVPVDEERVRHTSVTLPIPLDPYTDYILDIESVDIGAPMSTKGDLVLRRAFDTGAFASTEAFVSDFVGTPTEHRAAQTGALQAVGAAFAAKAPEGAEFDTALRDAGLEPMPVPDSPRVLIFWQQTNPAADPQPAAVMIDASEPLHRTRALPEEVESDDDVPVKRLVLTQQEWLTIAEGPSGGNIVDRVVFAPGGQRALLTLKPNSRGKVLHVDMIRRAFTEPYLDGAAATDTRFRIVAETLARAPWEED